MLHAILLNQFFKIQPKKVTTTFVQSQTKTFGVCLLPGSLVNDAESTAQIGRMG
jgi:hypothetical protein